MKKLITVVGVGALGSHAAMMLRNEGRLRLIDFDRVEQKNVLSQFHGASAVGKNKALGLRHTLDFLFKVKSEERPHKLTSENAATMLGGSDLVLDCLDNPEGRKAVREACRAAGLPLLHGALAADGAYGMAAWDEDFLIEDGAGAPTCEGGEHLPFVCLASAAVAKAAQTFLKSGVRRSFHVWPEGVRRV